MALKIAFTPDRYRLEADYWRQDEDKRKASSKDPWGFLLYMGSHSEHPRDKGLAFACGLGEAFYEQARESGTIPSPQYAKDITENKQAVLQMLGIPEDWPETAWLGMTNRLLKEQKKAGSLSRALQYFQTLLCPEGTLCISVQETKSPDHPFNLEFGVVTGGGQKRAVKPLSSLLNNGMRLRPATRTCFRQLLQITDRNEWLARKLYDGSLEGPVPLNAQESWELLEEHHYDGLSPLFEWDIPDYWQKGSGGSFSISGRLGLEDKGLFSADSLVSLRPSLVINGQEVSEEELEEIASMEEGLHFLKGKWTVVRHNNLEELMDQMERMNRKDLTIYDAMRLQAGFGNMPAAEIHADQWLESWLQTLRHPETNRKLEIPETVKAHLFPYQQTGYSWLDMMRQVHLGACLADDMGLGKTLQVLALLQHVKEEDAQARSLAVVPASLLSNWKKEAEKFTPRLKVHVLHGRSVPVLEKEAEEVDADLFITTYGMTRKLEKIKEDPWTFLILDEAQAIKNPTAKQTHAVKAIPAKHKLALTGTPVENDLGNLWSIFDFLNKGLLGSWQDFRDNVRQMGAEDPTYQKLRLLVEPFLLRRLKTDKNVIADLPDKIEKTEYVTLSKRQTALYLQEVKRLEGILKDRTADRITRSGRVLAALTHFKQICNHPDQFLGKADYKTSDSGKFEMLKDICGTIRDNHECVLVFTQYKEIIPHLDACLEDVFGHPGLVIHGSTPIKKRQEIVDAFEKQESWIPYMVLSLKAGGTGLNLTAANHVIHFDRWWNPAVENQATDRAFRIGQTKQVIVHKFLSAGTIEEHIDELIESKKELAENVIGSGTEKWITEMDDKELMKLVTMQ